MKKLVPIILILLFAAVATAQNKSSIVGTVTTAEGLVIADVKVTITSDSLIAHTLSTTTNERGKYRFSLLPIGTYDIKFEKEGYSIIEQMGIIVTFNSTATIDKVMQPGGFEETVVIIGEAPIIDKTTSAIADKLDLSFLQNIPNTRAVFNLPNLSAGFTDNSGLGGVQSDGNSFNIDGVDVTDRWTAYLGTSMNIEAVEQVDVALFGAQAEYSGFTGAALNVVTKSGGNDFHGEVNYFMQRVGWVSDNTGNYTQYGITAPTASRLDNPNFALGGPILRDKVWFFTNFNFTKSATERQLIDETITQTLDPKRFFLKLSGQWDKRNITYFSFQWYKHFNSHRRYNGGWRSNYESSLWEQPMNYKTYQLQHTYILSDDFVLEGRYYKQNYHYENKPKLPNGQNLPCLWDNAWGVMLPGSSAMRWDIADRPLNSLLVTLNYFNDNLGGSHSMKYGFDWYSAATPRYMSLTNWQDTWMGEPWWKYDMGVRDGGTTIKNYAFFVQDSWSMTDKLTLNLGVRYDRTSLSPYDASNSPSGTTDSFATMGQPAYRLGFAYDLFGDGKTVIRGFAGRYYEGVQTGNTESLSIKMPPGKAYMWVDNEWVLQYMFGGSTGLFSISDDFTNQYTEGFSFGVDRELMENIAASFTFVYKKDSNIIGLISPAATWVMDQTSFSNENGSYNGSFYNNYNPGDYQLYTNPKKGNPGILEDPFRKYWGLLFEFNKRMSENWSLKANYTYSRNTANWEQWSGAFWGGNDVSNPNRYINSGGRAYLERPHVLKLSGTYIVPFDIFISPVVTYYSGTPYGLYYRPTSTSGSLLIKEIDGTDRYDSRFNVDLRLEKSFTFADRLRAGIIFDAFNLFNDDAVTGYNSTLITSSNFLIPSSIVDARFYQLGFRLTF